MESKFSHNTVKFDEFERKPHLINTNIDLVGIIAKIGELKYANQAGDTKEDKSQLAIRDLQIYDDTFTMVRLLLRNHLAENCHHFKIDDIISLKNVRIMKVQNRFVMTTLPDTVIEVNTAAYEVSWLKQWFLHNRQDIVRNNYMQFNNLSMTPAKPKKEREKDIASSKTVECSPAKMPRLSQPVSFPINIVENVNESSMVSAASSQSSPASPTDSKSDYVRDNDNWFTPKSQETTPNGFVHVISDEENDTKTNNQEEKKETSQEVIGQKEGIDEVKKDERIVDEVEEESHESRDVKKDLRYETFNILMHSPVLENDWDEEKDQYLVNFITKNSYDLRNDLVYNKLITEMPDVFAKTTPAVLKERLYMLSTVRNFLYLMKLCGGDHLTTEKEKTIFLVKVEKLRDSMKLINTS